MDESVETSGGISRNSYVWIGQIGLAPSPGRQVAFGAVRLEVRARPAITHGITTICRQTAGRPLNEPGSYSRDGRQGGRSALTPAADPPFDPPRARALFICIFGRFYPS